MPLELILGPRCPHQALVPTRVMTNGGDIALFWRGGGLLRTRFPAERNNKQEKFS